ncbi:acetyl/propionyl/methylcrotonyl-CoA carboxylase subunit alpha [Gallaecimonas sp. GXIMD1310]|uniref:acetyl/propionyl/methylcrotonyl-CoA carboxylase subunit alpha n=1 Tax=Gallaecimonas sp. GXIMD1310 TaxID=3131926 RepID=UPI0032484031
MFKTLLIANRGEIACRVIRTAHRLGLRCIAVYSDADRHARHVQMADEAWHLGPAEAAQSYLRADKILAIAKAAGADAIHPGYGFLSENSAFARACDDAGIAFVGPPTAAIEAMGSKSAAKAIMADAGVPLVPGYHGDDQSEKTLLDAAINIGFPQLIKAAMGGGGKGMRVVDSAEQVKDAIAAARREAKSAFGDEHLLIERYLTRPRHVEVQVFADQHGNCIYLGDRDCSAQRRHQKVVEEAPAPGLSDNLRRAMGEAAVKAAQAIGYVGAGTVEFLLDGDDFYFMEMNTRLQVEHPVTEMVTGQDLVHWQLLVAAGQPLPLTQQQVRCDGHSVEVRIYAEDPYKDFLPQSGTLTLLREPEDDVRIDTGVRQGDEISPFYDPMIAKLIVHASDRASALRSMSRALDQYRLAGIKANVGFLRRLVSHPAFMAADLSTRFIEQHQAELTAAPQWNEQRLALAALTVLAYRHHNAAERREQSHEPGSLWHRANGWRLNANASLRLQLDIGDNEPVIVMAEHSPDGWQLRFHEHQMLAQGHIENDRLYASLDGHQLQLPVWQHEDGFALFEQGQPYQWREYQAALQQLDNTDSELVAPMNGTVVATEVNAGDSVKAGDTLVVMEAMKMEYTIAAPRDGIVAEVFYQAGDRVSDGAELVRLEEEA